MTEKREFQNFIDGDLATAADGRATDVVNPSTGEVYGSAPLSGQPDLDRAFAAAQRAFDEGWRDTTPSDRQKCLLRMAQAIEDNADRLVAVESENTGKP